MERLVSPNQSGYHASSIIFVFILYFLWMNAHRRDNVILSMLMLIVYHFIAVYLRFDSSSFPGVTNGQTHLWMYSEMRPKNSTGQFFPHRTFELWFWEPKHSGKEVYNGNSEYGVCIIHDCRPRLIYSNTKLIGMIPMQLHCPLRPFRFAQIYLSCTNTDRCGNKVMDGVHLATAANRNTHTL